MPGDAPRFDFHEVVTVHHPDVPVQGGEGVVLARGGSAAEGWGYTVSVTDDGGLCWDFAEEWLRPTGRKLRREDLYDETRTIRVRVDEQGRGWPAERDDA